MHRSYAVHGLPDLDLRCVETVAPMASVGLSVGPNLQAASQQLRLTIPNVATFLICNGRSVEFAPEPGADPGTVQLYLNGTVRAALVHQRGELPLHAASLVPPGGRAAIAICGDSGAGKSTLAMALSRRGWRLVADDTTRLSVDGTQVMCWPSGDSIKLWRDACLNLGIDPTLHQRVSRDYDKYYVSVPAHPGPIALGTVLELALTHSTDPLSMGERMSLVTRHTARPSFIRPLGMVGQHVRIAATVAASCAIHRLGGSRSVPVQALADAVERLAADQVDRGVVEPQSDACRSKGAP
jgi:hypothetical protein